jgi:hypothetical protein
MGSDMTWYWTSSYRKNWILYWYPYRIETPIGFISNIVSDFSMKNKICPVPSVSFRKCVQLLTLYVWFFNKK